MYENGKSRIIVTTSVFMTLVNPPSNERVTISEKGGIGYHYNVRESHFEERFGDFFKGII